MTGSALFELAAQVVHLLAQLGAAAPHGQLEHQLLHLVVEEAAGRRAGDEHNLRNVVNNVRLS